jgi:hypothetical protein
LSEQEPEKPEVPVEPGINPTEPSQPEPEIDPAVEPMKDPPREPEHDPVREPEHDPKPQPFTEPRPDPAAEPMRDPMPQPVQDPVITPLQGKLSILDLAAGVLILAFLSLFAVNSYIAYLANDYNERMCQVAIGLAGKAATDGKDTIDVNRAAFGFMDKCGPGGFFVERPVLIHFYDEIGPQLRQVTTATSTRVLIPAPFIIADKSRLEPDGMHMVFKSIYQFQLKNPKNCQSDKVRINPTGRTFEIKMIDQPVNPAPPTEKQKQEKLKNQKKKPGSVSNPGSAG